jgi:Spy/CpxP family protein refolding chaperone
MFGGGRAMFDPSVSSEDMDHYGEMLKLTKTQKEAIKSLHDAYVQDFTSAAEKARDEMDSIREEGGDDRFQAMGDVMSKFRAKRTEMEKSFFNEVKQTLTPEQQAQWPAIERLRRRETTMNRGLMSGERVDLVKIVDDLKLSAEAKKPVDQVLEQYQIDLDRDLIARNEVQDKFQGNFRELMQDPDKAEKAFQEGRAAATKLRDVNKRYERQVENALPDDTTKAKFEEEVHKASFPLIYRNSRASRTVDAAEKLESLTPEQKSSIQNIKDQFNKELSALRSKMETAYEAREQTITAADVMGRFTGGRRGGGDNGGGPGGQGGRRGGGFGAIDSPELDTLAQQQTDLEKATIEKINAVLTPDQKAEMPQDRQGGGRRMDGGDNGNGGGRGNRPRGNRPNSNPSPAPNGRT